MLTRSCKCGETLSDAALTYALVTDKNNQWENRHDSDKKADKNNLIVWSQWQENRRETAKGPANLLNLLFSNAPMLSCLQKGKNNIMRTQELWFSSYMRVWWMCQCLLLVKTESICRKMFRHEHKHLLYCGKASEPVKGSTEYCSKVQQSW